MKKKLIRKFKKNKLVNWIIKKRRDRKKMKMCLQIAQNSKINKKQIIFSAFSGRLYACSPKAIYEYMIQNPEFDDYTFIWAFNKPDSKRDLFTDRRTTVVKFNSKEFFIHLSSSKYWIFNFKTPDFFIKKKEQIFIQCWHGTPLKKIGLDIKVEGNAATDKKEIHKSYLEDTVKYDYFISPSKYASDRFKSSFGMSQLHKENIIIEKGYPRNDAIFNYDKKQVNELKEKLHIDTTKKVILYCPTFRDDQYKKGVGHTYDLGINLLRLKEELSDEYVLLLRLHYLVSSHINISQFQGFAYDVSEYDDVNDLYLISNLLITDYSSVFFDYANLKKPMIFYMYDLEEYKHNLRDFYIDIDELPGPIVEKERDLIKQLKNIQGMEAVYKDKYEQFNARYVYLDDGHATERVVKEFM